MCADNGEYKEIKHRLTLMETTMRSVVGDVTDIKGLLTEHIKQDAKRTKEFRKREDFFIDSIMKVTEAAERMERIFNGKNEVTVE